MRKLRRELGFALEPRYTGRIRFELSGEDLERDLTPELLVPGQVHLAHPARAEAIEHGVVREFLAPPP